MATKTKATWEVFTDSTSRTKYVGVFNRDSGTVENVLDDPANARLIAAAPDLLSLVRELANNVNMARSGEEDTAADILDRLADWQGAAWAIMDRIEGRV